MQTSYSATANSQLVGQPSDGNPNTIVHLLNGESVGVPFGIGVQRHSATEFEEADDGSAPFYGITVQTHWNDSSALAGTDAIAAAQMASIMTSGRIAVKVEEAVVAGDRAYCRVTSDGGSNTQLGGFRKSSDSGRAVVFPGRYDTTQATIGGVAILVFNCDVVFGDGDNITNDEVVYVVPMAEATATTTFYKFTPSATQSFVITGAEIYNPTGLAGSTSNSHKITIQNASVGVSGTWDTETGQEGTITAATCMPLTNGSVANRTVAAAAVVSVLTTLTGSKTLPAGFMTIKGYLVK